MSHKSKMWIYLGISLTMAAIFLLTGIPLFLVLQYVALAKEIWHAVNYVLNAKGKHLY